jgi:hypothetical protein
LLRIAQRLAEMIHQRVPMHLLYTKRNSGLYGTVRALWEG